MTESRTQFGRFTSTILLFGGMAFSIKYLDIVKFATFELGSKSDKSMVVGTFSTLNLFFTLAAIASLILFWLNDRIEDMSGGNPEIPDFPNSIPKVSNIELNMKFIIQKFLFFILKIFPIICGIIFYILTFSDFIYFFEKIRTIASEVI